MTEITLSTRVDKHLARDIEGYMEAEHLEKASAVRRLLYKSVHEWKLQYALDKLEKGEFTITKASDFAEVDVFTLASKIKASGIRWVDEEGVIKDIKSFRG